MFEPGISGNALKHVGEKEAAAAVGGANRVGDIAPKEAGGLEETARKGGAGVEGAVCMLGRLCTV